MTVSLIIAALLSAVTPSPVAATPFAPTPIAVAPATATTSTPATPTSRALRIAVLSFERNGIDEDVGSLLDESLLAELRKLARTSVVGMAEIRQMLDFEAARQSMGCGAEGSCLAEIADSLGVDVLLTGSLTLVGTESIIVLRRIDQHTAAVAGTFTQRLEAAGGEELLAAVGPAVQELFVEVPLRAGVTRGVDPRLALRLNPPPLSPWMPVTAGIVSAVAFAGAGAGFVATQVLLGSYRDDVKNAGDRGIDGAALVAKGQTASTVWIASWVALGVGVGVAGIAAAMVPLTDWQQTESSNRDRQ